jgi:hypothetical protein
MLWLHEMRKFKMDFFSARPDSWAAKGSLFVMASEILAGLFLKDL